MGRSRGGVVVRRWGGGYPRQRPASYSWGNRKAQVWLLIGIGGPIWGAVIGLGCAAFIGCNASRAPGSEVEAQEVSSLIARLDWRSIGYEEGGRIKLVSAGEEDVAGRLVKVGRQASNELVKALSNPEKAVAAHIILCSIWDPNARGGSSEEIAYEGDKIVGHKYSFRGLVWRCDLGLRCSVDRESQAAVEHQWRGRLEKE